MQFAEYLHSSNLARFPFLFIVTYGRSGSTLLQGILNTAPGYCIRGENYNALFNLFKAYHGLSGAKHRWGGRPTDSAHPWHGIEHVAPMEFARRAVGAFFATCLRPPAETRCVGFKEIRYTPQHMNDDEFIAYLDFVGKMFPGAGLIFNIRKPQDTVLSGFWRQRVPERAEADLSHSIQRFATYADGRENAMLFSYDELMADWRYCEGLFSFLAEKVDEERIQEILHQRHSFGGQNGRLAAGL